MSVLNRELPYVNAYGTVDISKSKNVYDALCMAGMNWEVESKPLYDEYGNEYPGFRANVKSDDDSLLGIVSNSYKIVQNEDAFKFIDNLVDEGFNFDKAGVFRGGKSIWVMGNFPKETILGDDIANNLVFVNSHDGSSGVKVMMTPVRLICSNMINMATRKADRIWAAKHTRRIETRMDEARYTLGLANKYISALKEEADILSNKKVTDAQLEAIFDIMFPIDPNKDSERKIRNTTILKNNFFACYNESDIAKFKGTAWGAVNAMADLITHSNPTRLTESYYENAWNKLIGGHPVFDNFCKRIKA